MSDSSNNREGGSLSVEKINPPSSLHWVHWLIIALSLVLTISAWHYSSEQVKAKAAVQFNYDADNVIELLVDRMSRYEDALLASVAHVLSDPDEEKYYHPDKWKAYIDHSNIFEKYPGIRGIGPVNCIKPDEVKNFLRIQEKRWEDFNIRPAHDRPILLPITNIAPLEGNRKAIGFDLASETNRYTAAVKACDKGESQITGPIILVQDEGKTPGFLFFAPFYKTQEIATLEERREQFDGVVSAVFVVKNLMKGVLEKERRNVAFSITDGETTLYDEHIEGEKDFDPNPVFSKTLTLPLFGRDWEFDLRSTLSFRDKTNSTQPLTILFGGIVIDGLLLGLFIVLSRSNRKAVDYAKEMNKEVLDKNLKLEQSDKYKSQFLANMSHELKTPLNSLMMLTDLLKSNRDGNLQDKQVKDLEYMSNAERKLLSLVDDIMDLSKVSAGVLKVHSSDVIIKSLLDQLENHYKKVAEGRGIEYEVTVGEGVPETIKTDELRIYQILSNLLDNSFKFTNKGYVKFLVEKKNSSEISNLKTSRSAEYLVFSVSDSGIGISKEDQEHIFDDFRQVDGSITRQHEGAGLGLSICQKIITLLEGEMWVKSEPGKGATFTVCLPLR